MVILAVALIFLGPSRLPGRGPLGGQGHARVPRVALGAGRRAEDDPYDELEDDYKDEAVEPGADDPDDPRTSPRPREPGGRGAAAESRSELA